MSRALTRRERRALEREQMKRAIPAAIPRKGKVLSVWYWLVPCIAAFCVYIPTLSYSFVSDDGWIFQNPYLRSWKYFFELFRSHPGMPRYYRRLYEAWSLLIYNLAGANPTLWHLSSLFLHVIATYLVFRVCFEILESSFAASCSALLFAIHPVNIEGVVWVLASDDILYVIFFLCSLLYFLLNLRKPRPLYRFLSLVASSVALLAKESVIALAPLFCCIAYFKSQGNLRARLKRAFWAGLPYLGIDIAYLCVRMIVFHNQFFGNGEVVTPSWRETVYSSPKALWFYVGKLLWPASLSPAYDLPLIHTQTFGMWFAIVLIALAIVAVIWVTKRHSPIVGIGAALILLPILPVLMGMHFFPYGESVHDRYLYLSSVGFSLIVGLIAKELWRGEQTKPAWIFLGTAVVAFGVLLCLTQEGFYHDEEALRLRPVELAPDNPRFLKILGSAYVNEGRSDLAIQYFTRAYDLNPGDDGMGK